MAGKKKQNRLLTTLRTCRERSHGSQLRKETNRFMSVFMITLDNMVLPVDYRAMKDLTEERFRVCDWPLVRPAFSLSPKRVTHVSEYHLESSCHLLPGWWLQKTGSAREPSAEIQQQQRQLDRVALQHILLKNRNPPKNDTKGSIFL